MPAGRDFEVRGLNASPGGRSWFALKLLLTSLAVVLLSVVPARAQNSGTADSLMDQASGTSVNPHSAPMEMLSMQQGGWTLMLHGQMFLNHANDSGPRGADKTFSTNWAMGMA